MANLPHVIVSDSDGVAVVSPVGEFDISTVDMLRATILEAVGTDANRLVVDLSKTTFVDSMALGVMLGAGRRINERGGWLRLVAPLPNVRKVLGMTGLDKVFNLYDTVEQAVTHADSSSGDADALELA